MRNLRSKREMYYDLPTVTKKGKDWNEVVTTHVLPEHQPTRFSENLNDEDIEYSLLADQNRCMFSPPNVKIESLRM